MIGQTVATAGSGILGVSAQRVYSEPVTVGDTVVIPAATIGRYGGFGREAGGRVGDGSGRPVAVIEASTDGVVVRPVVDLTKIGLTLAAAALTVWRAARR